jgi:putative transposase
MARRARIMLGGVPVHIIQRGHNRNACFFKEADYTTYLTHLHALAERFQCTVHAYCLMTNHVHLLLTPATKTGCGLLMKHLGQRYTQHVNRTYRRHGTLWEGRFRSCLVDSEDYLVACQRYIEQNPVRAGLVRRARDYLWSSHRGNAEGRLDALLTPHERYLALGRTRKTREAAYRALPLDDAIIEEIRLATNGGFVLGHPRFQNRIAQRLDRRVTRGKPGRPKGSTNRTKRVTRKGKKKGKK